MAIKNLLARFVVFRCSVLGVPPVQMFKAWKRLIDILFLLFLLVRVSSVVSSVVPSAVSLALTQLLKCMFYKGFLPVLGDNSVVPFFLKIKACFFTIVSTY